MTSGLSLLALSLLISSQYCYAFQNNIVIKRFTSKNSATEYQSIKSGDTENDIEIMNNSDDYDINHKKRLSLILPTNQKHQQHRRSFLLSNVLLGISTWSSNILQPQKSSIASAAVSSSSNNIISESSALSSELTSWPLGKVAFSLLPIAGTYSRRATVEKEVIPNTIWTYDQIQGIVNVNVPVRQVVIKLSPEAGGGLLVHNPVAPTKQLLSMMSNLEKEHGPIRHIVLGTVALEHKGTFGSFAQNYPNATVWLQPGQWSFPFNLPLEFLGVNQRGLKFRELPMINEQGEREDCSNSLLQHFAKVAQTNAINENKLDPEWLTDLSYEILGPLNFKSVGSFSETAFFHKSTKTLVVTDTVVSITSDPPDIIQEDPRAMLFHARDTIYDIPEDTYENRMKGWRRMVQFGFYFFPSQIDVVPFNQALADANSISKNGDAFQKSLGKDGVPYNLYPWSWKDSNEDIKNFNALTQNGKLFVPPILTKLILDREPETVQLWVDKVCRKFDFTHVISSHVNNYVKATPRDFRDAFEILSVDNRDLVQQSRRPIAEDLALLQKASDLLTRLNVVEVSRVCDGEPARFVGRFANSI